MYFFVFLFDGEILGALVMRLLRFGGAIGCANRANQASPPKKTFTALSGASAILGFAAGL